MLVSSRTAFARFAAVAAPAAKRSFTSSPVASMRLARSTHASAGLRPAWLCGVHPGSAPNHASASAAMSVRRFSEKAGQTAEAAAEQGAEEGAEKAKPEAAPEDPSAALKEKITTLEGEVKELRNRVLTSMADVENMRGRMVKKSEEDKKFAVRKFAAEMLEVADCLEKALEAAPEDKRKTQPDLQTMFEGVQLIETVFLKGLRSVDIAKFSPLGEKFDPNMHNGAFEMPAGEAGKGMVGAVIKSGYMIADRVLRPADVGVTK